MTLMTMIFRDHKARGLVTNLGKAWYRDGTRHLVRVVWRDETDGACYVVVNGNVLPVREERIVVCGAE